MYWNTVTPLLQAVLQHTMQAEIFNPFRLVGGTSLSLQLGHRISVDIDLFTDAAYGSLDFDAIDNYFQSNYAYVATNKGLPHAIGTSWYAGNTANDAVKIDIYYTDTFIRPATTIDGIRMAAFEDVAAMKMELAGQGARKKDFWDLHILHDYFSIPQLLELHQERYPYSYTGDQLRSALTNFETADSDLDPVCLQNKKWQLIKLDFSVWLERE